MIADSYDNLERSFKERYESLYKKFTEFKKYVCDELAFLREPRKSEESQNLAFNMETEYLKNHISSLEKQLDEKKEIISDLIKNTKTFPENFTESKKCDDITSKKSKDVNVEKVKDGSNVITDKNKGKD